MGITSKVEICNMSQSHLGNKQSINNIDTPTTDAEITYSLWYDVARQQTLKMVVPNFALGRLIVAKMSETPAFGYSYYYEYPQRCLKLLGLGNLPCKRNNNSVERTPISGKIAIATDLDYPDGLKIRFIDDVEDVTQFTSDFKIMFSHVLSAYVALDITQDQAKASAIEAALPSKMSSVSGMNAQENVPIRISRSQFREARFNDFPNQTQKK